MDTSTHAARHPADTNTARQATAASSQRPPTLAQPGLVVVWDSYGDAQYPNGCWVCGIEGQTPVFGDSPEEARARWAVRAASSL